MKEKFYLTTAIDYVNARPHIGHAFEKVLADTIARWKRLNNLNVRFLTGTDENAQKNAQAAKIENIETKLFVEKNSGLFLELCKKLNISKDRFIRTTEQDHIKKSQELFQIAYDNKDIYKGTYEGYYCAGCESYKTEKELVNGKCPEHGEVRWMSEESYFFKLSKYHKRIEKFVKNYIIPETRKNEILSRLEEEPLKDISVSRKNLDWGINTPMDKDHKIYVWFDALINYLTGAERFWPADLHVVGKGINWFHSVIWPAILFSTGQKTPKKLLVHGYINIKGEKMSKFSGNIIDPFPLIEKYGSDSVRYSLLRCSIFEDSDYSEEILKERHNNELANKLGNLISRVSTLAEKYGMEEVHGISPLDKEMQEKIIKHLDNYELDKALTEILAFIDKCNEFMQSKKPWENHNSKILYETANAIKDLSILLYPYLPETVEKISKIFNFEISLKALNSPLKISTIKKSEILFKRVD